MLTWHHNKDWYRDFTAANVSQTKKFKGKGIL